MYLKTLPHVWSIILEQDNASYEDNMVCVYIKNVACYKLFFILQEEPNNSCYPNLKSTCLLGVSSFIEGDPWTSDDVTFYKE